MFFVPDVPEFLAIEDQVDRFGDREISWMLLSAFFLVSIK